MRPFFTLHFNSIYQLITWLFFIFISTLSTVYVLVDSDKPSCYQFLFLLPLSFAILSFCFSELYYHLFDNLGVTLILTLLFVRSSIQPLLMSVNGYSTRIALNPNDNMHYAIFLLIYEMLMIFIVSIIAISRFQDFENDFSYISKESTNQIFRGLLTLAVILLVTCIAITPQLLEAYRTIFQMGEEGFSDYEDTKLISQYATSTVKKFSLVTGNYLARVLLAVIPGFLILKLHENKTRLNSSLALLCCFIPLFFIGGVIARSLIYVICLYYLYLILYKPNKIYQRIPIAIAISALLIIIWWSFKSDTVFNSSDLTMSVNAYFSGINNVYATFNMERNFDLRISYLIYDYVDAMPYGGTIFHNSHIIISDFFNSSNGVRGQIATTIGMGWYYFGPIFAPLYSILFSFISVSAGQQIKNAARTNPLKLIRLILSAMYFSLGIIIYNISITMTTVFTVLLPIYLLERYGYQKVLIQVNK